MDFTGAAVSPPGLLGVASDLSEPPRGQPLTRNDTGIVVVGASTPRRCAALPDRRARLHRRAGRPRLRWSEVNLDAATVGIRQTLLATEDGYRPIEDQKSAQSARTIHLDRRTVSTLRDHRDAQERARAEASDAWQDNDLVFARADGSWWNPPAISVAFGRAVKRAGVPHIRLHDVRHTHATLLLAAGINPKVVSERLGHSSVAFTLDTCGPRHARHAARGRRALHGHGVRAHR